MDQPGTTRSSDAPGARFRAGWAELFAILVRHAEDLHTVVDLQGRLLFANDAAREVFGCEPDECLGQVAFDFVHPDDRERTRQAFLGWVARRPGAPLHFENRQLSRAGTVREMAWTIYPRRDGDGELTGFAATARDVTEQRRAERELARAGEANRALVEGMLDPVLAIDGDGVIRMASRSVLGVFGYQPDELIGRNVSVLMPEPYRSEHDGYLAHYRATGETRILGRTREFGVVRKDGGIIEAELSVARVDPPGSASPLFIGSFRDVTERRRAERAERSMLRALATIGESSALLAHEIKNPVTALHMALRAVAGRLGEDEQEIVEDLASRMRRLELQMRQTLSFAKPLELHLVTCDAASILAEVARALRPVLTHAGVTLEWSADGAPAFVADPARLEEALTNVVSNAVEMLGPGGRIRARAVPDPPGHVVIEVEDDGPGVAPSLRDTLFKPFVTSKREGTGLGLPICRRIVEEHGGTIAVAGGPATPSAGSALGGACFRIRLPLRGPSETQG